MISREEQVDNSLRVAYEKAAQLLRDSDASNVCARTGAVFKNESYFVPFIGNTCEIRMPDVVFASGNVPLIAEVLILHYLTSRDIEVARGEYIGFSDIPGGMFYAKSFRQRALDKLVAHFGEMPEKLPTAGEAIGGRPWTTGDFSSIVPVLPNIELVVQIYRGDDEFPAEANILFPDCITNYFPVEDIAFLGGYLVGSLVRGAR